MKSACDCVVTLDDNCAVEALFGSLNSLGARSVTFIYSSGYLVPSKVTGSLVVGLREQLRTGLHGKCYPT